MIAIKAVKTTKNSKNKTQKNNNIFYLYTVKQSQSYCIEARILLLWHILQQLIHPNRRIAI